MTDDNLYSVFKTLKSNTTGEFIFDFKSVGHTYSITGDDVQKYLNHYHNQITAKMFRTWHTNCYFIQIMKNNLDYFKNLKNNFTPKLKKEVLKKACEDISVKLHNTANVIKNSYLNDMLFNLFMNKTNKFVEYLEDCESMSKENTLLYIEKEIRI